MWWDKPKVLQYFGKMSAIQQLTEVVKVTLGCEMPSSPDTLRVILARFASVIWSTASESTVLGLPKLAWLLRILQFQWNFFGHLAVVQWSTLNSLFALKIILVNSELELEYVVRSSVRLLKQSAHQLPRYYLPQLLVPIARAVLVTWRRHHKLTSATKILQNSWFA